ncbi:hypothetical protein ACJQWY_01375 [Weissella kandleri]|uniref:hypothetical protein n=1 Tax=Weissella kandleri TaxID=1616 RepID=UPI00387E55C3
MRPGSFIINDVDSLDLDAVIVNWFDTTIPERKITLNDSPIGIDRSIITDNKAYKNREFEITIAFRGKWDNVSTQITKFIQAIDGKGYVDACFYFDQEFIYKIVRTGVTSVERPSRISKYREIKVNISAMPYKYMAGEHIYEISSGTSLVVQNPFNYEAKPSIQIVATGTTVLKINNQSVSFTGLTGNIYLDSDFQDAWSYDKNNKLVNENSKMSRSSFPILESGLNTISISNGKAIINAKWRTL